MSDQDNDDYPFDEEEYSEEFLEELQEALKEMKEGKFFTHDQLLERMKKWEMEEKESPEQKRKKCKHLAWRYVYENGTRNTFYRVCIECGETELIKTPPGFS